MHNESTGSRYILVARKMIYENKRSLLMLVLGYLGALAVFGLWAGWKGASPQGGMLVFYAVLASITATVIASMMFSDFKTKEGRIAALMTPASMADKFLVRLTGVLPAMICLIIAGYFVFALTLKVGFAINSGVWLDIMMPWDIQYYTAVDYIGTIGGLLLPVCFFIFGSILWPRKSFLKTLLLGVAIEMVLFWSMFGIGTYLFDHYTVEILDEKSFGWIITGILYAIDICLVVCAYVLLKRTTIIK